MTDKDKPKVHFSASALAREAGDEVEEFVYMTKDNKRVVFPDPYAFDADEGEEKMYRWQTGRVTPGQIFKEWLSKDDLAALNEEKLTVRERLILFKHASGYYEKAAGSLGEDDGSGN